jgi:hypothetical protein
VVRARTPLFQSGDAPSRGPHRSHESTEQTTSTFIHQYVIYTHVDTAHCNQHKGYLKGLLLILLKGRTVW